MACRDAHSNVDVKEWQKESVEVRKSGRANSKRTYSSSLFFFVLFLQNAAPCTRSKEVSVEYFQDHREGQHGKRHRCIANVPVSKKGEIRREAKKNGCNFVFFGCAFSCRRLKK